MDTPMATMKTVEGRPVLRFERRFDHPPQKVWRAITEPAEMAHWFPASVTTDLAVGAAMRFSFADNNPEIDDTPYADGEVVELDPPKVYAFRWADTLLRFELIPDRDGCLLVFTQTLPGTGTHGDLPSAARQATGWDACLAGLAGRLDGASGPDLPETWWLRRSEGYVEAFGLGEGLVHDHGDGYVVRFERDLTQPADEVWSTLTGPGSEPAVGMQPPVALTHGYVVAGAVTEVTPPRTVEYAWLHEDTAAGRVRFELRPQQPLGTRLVVTHTLPARLGHLAPTVLAAWQTHLELLFAALHGEVRCPWPADRTDRLQTMYADRLASGPETAADRVS